MRIFTVAVCSLAFTFAGYASATTCPEPSQITQREQSGTIVYEAPGNWKGDTPRGQPHGSEDIRFTGSRITSTGVTCRYESADDGISLALSAPRKAGSGKWIGMACKSDSIQDCPFHE